MRAEEGKRRVKRSKKWRQRPFLSVFVYNGPPEERRAKPDFSAVRQSRLLERLLFFNSCKPEGHSSIRTCYVNVVRFLPRHIFRPSHSKCRGVHCRESPTAHPCRFRSSGCQDIGFILLASRRTGADSGFCPNINSFTLDFIVRHFTTSNWFQPSSYAAMALTGIVAGKAPKVNTQGRGIGFNGLKRHQTFSSPALTPERP